MSVCLMRSFRKSGYFVIRCVGLIKKDDKSCPFVV